MYQNRVWKERKRKKEERATVERQSQRDVDCYTKPEEFITETATQTQSTV